MNRKQFDAKVGVSQAKMHRADWREVWTAEDSHLAYVANTVAYLDQLTAAQVKAEARTMGLRVGASKFDAQYAIGVWAADRQVRRDNGESLEVK